MNKINKVVSIVVNYKRTGETLKAIDSLKNQKGKFNHRIIVVDNDSRDDSVRKLRSLKNINLIENYKNFLFSNKYLYYCILYISFWKNKQLIRLY